MNLPVYAWGRHRPAKPRWLTRWVVAAVVLDLLCIAVFVWLVLRISAVFS